MLLDKGENELPQRHAIEMVLLSMDVKILIVEILLKMSASRYRCCNCCTLVDVLVGVSMSCHVVVMMYIAIYPIAMRFVFTAMIR